MSDEKTIFEELYQINVNDRVEPKGKLKYLSWTWAWAELMKRYPDARATVYTNDDLGGMPYFTDGRTAMVHTSVTIGDITHDDWLPIMDNYMKSIPLESVTSFNVNTAIQRSITKAIARHGLGLYIYAGEDLPEDEPIDESLKQDATEDELNNFMTACESAGFNYKEIWKASGKAKDMTKAHLGKAQLKLAEYSNAKA